MTTDARKSFLFSMVLIGFSAFTVSVGAAVVQLELQAAIFAKILNYDSRIADSSKESVTFNIVVDESTSPNKSSLLAAFKSIAAARIGGKRIQVKSVSSKNISQAISNHTINVIYLPDGSKSATLSALVKFGVDHQVPILVGNELMAKKGGAIGIAVVDNKPKIVVNLKQSKSMGMRISTQLLRLAKTI